MYRSAFLLAGKLLYASHQIDVFLTPVFTTTGITKEKDKAYYWTIFLPQQCFAVKITNVSSNRIFSRKNCSLDSCSSFFLCSRDGQTTTAGTKILPKQLPSLIYFKWGYTVSGYISGLWYPVSGRIPENENWPDTRISDTSLKGTGFETVTVDQTCY